MVPNWRKSGRKCHPHTRKVVEKLIKCKSNTFHTTGRPHVKERKKKKGIYTNRQSVKNDKIPDITEGERLN